MYISDLSVNTLSFLNKNENKNFLFDYDTVETLFFFSMPSTNSDMESMITTHTVTPTNTPDTKFARVKPSRVSAGLKFIYSEKTTKFDEIFKLF